MNKKDDKIDEQLKEVKARLRYNSSMESFVKEIFFTLREMITHKKVITEANEIMEDIYNYQKGAAKKHSQYSKGEKRSFAMAALTLLNTGLLGILYLVRFGGLKETILTNFFLYLVLAAVAPFVGWVCATNENFWAFHKRKRVFFYLCCINMFLVVMQPIYTAIRNLVTGAVFKIPTNAILTYKMVEFLAYIGILLLLGIVCVVIYSQFEPLITNEALKRQIEIFKLQHIHDNRQERDYKYDMTIVKSLETGQSIKVKENDRFVQTEINGASGTGKTSSIFIPAIENDLNQKIKNREKRQEELLKLIQGGKATIKGPLREFNENAIVAVGRTKKSLEKNQKELEKIRKMYPDCGITVVAPNNSLIEDIIRLCEARGIKVNILDPVYSYANKYENAKDVSINPFYIPLGLDENERLIRISEAATVFSDVLIATNQMGGESDVYFTDISLSVSSNVSTIVMLAKNIEGQQAYIEDVHNCISNFENIRPYIQTIEEHYKTTFKGLETSAKTATANFNPNTKSSAEKPKVNKDVIENPYYQQILFVMQELLGAGGSDMFSQARGLRNLINKILQDPRIKKKLSAQEEGRVDFDGILANNEITVVNSAIELGKSTSTAFGLFFILLHKTSVLRRKVETRSPHFLWIDEATQYMHPCYEDMISLYRQYRTAVVITLQSLTQTERSKATAYLKDVFLGAGTHIVFGRLTPEEMKLYSEMGGISREMEEQTSYTSNSILTSSPSYSESVRSTPTVKNVLEGGDMRTLDFQELTIFTIDNGRVLPGQLGRVFFITEDAFDKQETRDIRWERVVPEAFKLDAERTNTKEYEFDATKKLLTADFDEVPYSVETSIPEEETETLVEKTNEEKGRIVEEGFSDNMSLEELMAFLDGNSCDGEPEEVKEPISAEPEVTVPSAENEEEEKQEESAGEDDDEEGAEGEENPPASDKKPEPEESEERSKIKEGLKKYEEDTY